MGKNTEHPDAYLAALLAKGGRPVKLRNLQTMHEICRAQYESGSRDISIVTIGKLCESQGLLTARGLYNAPMADYRNLIKIWAEYAGPPAPKPAKQLATDEYLMQINDPAIRAIVQGVIAERNKLKAQLNTLQADTKIVVDLRPNTNANVPALGAALTDSELTALTKAISPEFLEGQGWREANFGEIVTQRGRTVFDPGFATALRKITTR